MYVIVCKGLMGHTIVPTAGQTPAGLFLSSYEPEAHDGLGEAAWTAELSEAMKFVDEDAAFKCWSSVPENRPIRADGRMNRPLTAFTVEIVSEERYT